MTSPRLPLFSLDVVRELCPTCQSEKFQFVPTGVDTTASPCRCGSERELVDLSETSIRRLVTRDSNFEIRTVRNF